MEEVEDQVVVEVDPVEEAHVLMVQRLHAWMEANQFAPIVVLQQRQQTVQFVKTEQNQHAVIVQSQNVTMDRLLLNLVEMVKPRHPENYKNSPLANQEVSNYKHPHVLTILSQPVQTEKSPLKDQMGHQHAAMALNQNVTMDLLP